MGEDVRGIAEDTGSGNLPPIPEIEENPKVPAVEDTPLAGEIAEPSSGTSSVPLVDDIDAWVEVSSVKDSVTSGFAGEKVCLGVT